MLRIRIRVAKNPPNHAKFPQKNHQNHKNIIQFFQKYSNLSLSDLNIYPINNKTDYFLEKYIFNRKKKKQKKVCIFLDSRSYSEQDPVPDPLFHATDPRIRIHIKMKRIRNSLIKCIINYYETH